MGELIWGKNSVIDAVKNKVDIEIIYTTRPNEVHNFKNVKFVDRKYLDKLVQSNHQGFVARIKDFQYYSLSEIIQDAPEKILMLDHIQDPGNLGAILRSANAFGWNHIIMPKDRATKVTPVTIKTSSGGYIGLKIARVSSLQSSLEKLKNKGYWSYATNLDKKSMAIDEANFNLPLVLIIGNEEKGVSNTLIKHSDQELYIPISGTVQSLNVSVAAGIILSKI